MKKALYTLLVLLMSLAFAGCAKEEGTLEKAGKKADEKVEEAGKSLKKLKKKAEDKLKD